MNLILEKTKQVKFFTNMRDVFRALRINCDDYDWYLSDVETNGFDIPEGWLSGVKLNKLIQGKDIQFIWSVFSAFPAGVRVDVTKEPYVYGNPTYWNGGEVYPQLEQALFEIVCWDSSATILIGLEPEMEHNFRLAYSDTIDLSEAAR